MDDEEVEALKLARVEGGVVPVLVPVVGATVAEVADVVDRDERTVDLGPGKARLIGRPVAVVRGLDRLEPPENQETEPGGEDDPVAAAQLPRAERDGRDEDEPDRPPQPTDPLRTSAAPYGRGPTDCTGRKE